MRKQRAKRRKNRGLRQSFGGSASEVSPRSAAGESISKAPPTSSIGAPVSSPLDLGLEDLLAIAEDNPACSAEDGLAETDLIPSLDEPLSPRKSPYAELAVAEHWPALVHLCEREGLKTLLSQVWWIRAHLEAQSMPVELLQPSFERAMAEEKGGDWAANGSELDEIREVLRSCRRWFGIKPASAEELKVEKLEVERLVEGAVQQPTIEAKGVSSFPISGHGESKEEQPTSSSEKTSPETERGYQWSRRVFAFGILGLIVAAFVHYYIGMRDDQIELIAAPIPNEPLPRVVPRLHHDELVPLTSLEVLQVAMDDLVNVREEVVATDTPPIASPPPAQPRQRETVRITPTPSREELMMDGPLEPAAIGDLRIQPEDDPTAAERDRKDELRSVWDRVNSGSAALATPTPSKSVTDFFDGFDDHPGYPVERYHAPQACELADKAAIRTRPSELAPVTAELAAGDTVMIDQRIGPWVRLQGKSGRPGFARANCRWEAKPMIGSGRKGEDWRR